MDEQLANIRNSASESIKNAQDVDDLEEIRVRFLGRKGELTRILRSLGEISSEDRATIGKKSNVLKNEISDLLDNRKRELTLSQIDDLATTEWIDVTLNAAGTTRLPLRGHYHPISKIQYEMEDLFTSMGFEILDGPDVETEYYNFEALNIPEYHPARDIQDTFWTEDGNLLRTHTSSIQIRGMEKRDPPFRIAAPGRVFRYEAIDASHEHTFYQVEGMMVDRTISVSHLIFIMKEILKGIFKREVDVRIRPSYYPFVEPGLDLDFKCMICGGKGCKVCKYVGWIEFLGCGMVHPNVLRYGNIDPDEWTGFAFGMGLNRLVMMLYEINDIRHFLSGDVRFLYQF